MLFSEVKGLPIDRALGLKCSISFFHSLNRVILHNIGYFRE